MSMQPLAPPAAAPSVPPMPARIRRLTLTDFRAFPGPVSTAFDLDSKNLLVYGENGAGKSSLFYALSGFFLVQAGSPFAGVQKRVLRTAGH
jgi:recombinational DNA repair ATPase RecF